MSETALVTQTRITVTPRVALIDVDRHIVIEGFAAYAQVTLVARALICGANWRSEAVFLADAQGRIDLTRDSPVRGAYDRPSGMGMVWSMTCQDMDRVVYPPNTTDTIVVSLQATDGQTSVHTDFEQCFLSDGVKHESIRVALDGMTLAGELYSPPGVGPFPVVIYLNGSSGGVNEPRAALFAAHGYQCLALGVFNYEDRPKYLNDMPLEYFEQTLSWVHKALAPRDGFVAVSGISRGGEMSLLIAAHYPPQVSAVIAYVPSLVTHGVVSAGSPDTGRDAQVWTRSGVPLPHLWQNNLHADWDAAYATDPPYRQSLAFLSALKDVKAFERALIPIENFKGPVMLVSASDDGFWPSTAFSELVVQRLHDAGCPIPAQHHVCAGAGHHVHYPNLPATLIAKPHAMSGLLLDGGGTPAANAAGNVSSYWSALAFLQQARNNIEKTMA